MRNTRRGALAGGAALAGAALLWRYWPRPLPPLAEAAPPLPAPDGPLRTYHLGHSLVGRDMPAMLAQLAGHDFASQLGWGTPLKAHWQGAAAINGFETENAHARFAPASVLEDGGFDALIVTEMVDIHDAVKYHDSAEYLARWATFARKAAPGLRVYLYETWPHRQDDAQWRSRMEQDYDPYWQNALLRRAARTAGPIHMIPAGQVVAAWLRAGRAGEDLLARTETGAVDTVHLNDHGAYLVALTHFATLYHRDPQGAPHRLRRADGTPADAPTAAQAARMQRLVWDVVHTHPATGVSA